MNSFCKLAIDQISKTENSGLVEIGSARIDIGLIDKILIQRGLIDSDRIGCEIIDFDKIDCERIA